jgi:hypothetical protein
MQNQTGIAERSAQVLGRRSSVTPAGLEPFSFPGLILARRKVDPRERNSGLPCRAAWFRLFDSKWTLLDDLCERHKLHTPEAIHEVVDTFRAVYVRAFDVIDLRTLRIPADDRISSSVLDSGCREHESWRAFQRCLAAVDGGHPEGVIVEDDPVATSIFVARDALAAHTTLDRLSPQPLAELLEERALRLAAA